MADFPYVSVVIPAYNAADRLPTALDSVQAQAYPSEKLEVIVVDDGSTDDTAAVARDHLQGTSPMETQVMSVENGGPSRARNIGWRRSSSEWIQFLDDDDLLASDKIEIQAEYAKSAPSDVAVLHSDWERLNRDKNGEWISAGVAQPWIDSEDPLVDLLSAEGFIHLGSALFKKEWLNAVDGFDEQCWIIEDVHLMLRLAMTGGEFHRVPSEESLFFYRQRGEESLSGKSQADFARGVARNALLVEEFWRDKEALSDERIDFLTRVYFYAARELSGCDWKGCMEVWRHIQEISPEAVPPKPRLLHNLTRLFGYPYAQRAVLWVQYVKHFLRSAIPSR